MCLSLALGLECGLAGGTGCVIGGLAPLSLPTRIKAHPVRPERERRSRALHGLGTVLFDHLGGAALCFGLGKIGPLRRLCRIAAALKGRAQFAAPVVEAGGGAWDRCGQR